MDGRADLHGRSAAQQRLDGSLTVVYARRYGNVELREYMGAERRAAQHVAQFPGLAERIPADKRHLLDVDIGFEEAVEEHPGQQGTAYRQHVGQAHRQFHRNGDLHRSGLLAHDLGIALFELYGIGMPVGRQQEDVQLQELALVGIAEVTLEVFAGIAVSLHAVERCRLTVDLSLENGFLHHGTGTVAHAALDVLHRRRIGRAADDHGALQFEPEVFCFVVSFFLN